MAAAAEGWALTLEGRARAKGFGVGRRNARIRFLWPLNLKTSYTKVTWPARARSVTERFMCSSCSPLRERRIDFTWTRKRICRCA